MPGAELLREENIAYGFWRNLRGVRSAALPIVAVALGVHLLLLTVIGVGSKWLLGATSVGLILVAAIACWRSWVTDHAVEKASHLYAERLFLLQTSRDSSGSTPPLQ